MQLQFPILFSKYRQIKWRMKKENVSHKAEDKATVFQVAEAVFFSFIGIRKKSDLERDAARIKPVQIVVGGLVGGAIFIFSVLSVVKLVTG